jgi:hypothetical protein
MVYTVDYAAAAAGLLEESNGQGARRDHRLGGRLYHRARRWPWLQAGGRRRAAALLGVEQIGCVLRPRSVVNADMALRCFAGFLAETAPAGQLPDPGHPAAHRGVQAVAGGPARPEQARRDHRDNRAPARHAADVLRPDR